MGAGEPFSRDVARGIMLLRINNLAKGFSGTRLELVETLVQMLNRGVTPVIPQKGSLGASGDLAPLSHMVLPMLGLGQAEYQGEVLPGAVAMERAGIPTIELVAKEGLALINGTQAMTSVGALAVYDAISLIKTADVAAALSFEANRGVEDALDPRVHAVRPHDGQMKTASNLRKLLFESGNVTCQGELRVQDGYSLRCVPQVHGASSDAIAYVKSKVEIEMNAVTDNPIIFKETMEGISGGNFHGQPMALAFDFLGIAHVRNCRSYPTPFGASCESQFGRVPRFPGEKRGLELRFYDCAVFGGSVGIGKQGLSSPGQRRQHSFFRRPGGPCEHGHHRSQKGGGDLKKCAPGSGHGAHVRMPGRRSDERPGEARPGNEACV